MDAKKFKRLKVGAKVRFTRATVKFYYDSAYEANMAGSELDYANALCDVLLITHKYEAKLSSKVNDLGNRQVTITYPQFDELESKIWIDAKGLV